MIIPVQRASAILLASGTIAACLAGCIKRFETIRISPDGTADLQVVFKGTPDDIHDGDASLESPGPWTVKDELVEKARDDEDELTRTATLTVEPGEEFPTHYAGDDAELAELALSMSTSLRIEPGPDGTYYHFKRIYHRRDLARVNYFRQAHLEDGFEKLEDKEPEELTDEDLHSIANAVVAFEGVKTLVLAEAAAESFDPPLPQEEWLAIHAAIAEVFQQVDLEEVARLLQMQDEEADAAIADAVREVSSAIERRITQILNRRDPSGLAAAMYLEQFDRERQRYAITEDLQDEAWEVTVQLPGTIVGHNSLGAQAEGGEIKWEFDGDCLNDRDQVLMATSVVEKQ